MIQLENNKYYECWLRGYQSENMMDNEKGFPPDEEETTTGSPNVTNTSVPSMATAAMDITVQGMLSCKLEKSLLILTL